MILPNFPEQEAVIMITAKDKNNNILFIQVGKINYLQANYTNTLCKTHALR